MFLIIVVILGPIIINFLYSKQLTNLMVIGVTLDDSNVFMI